jgi:hypothetical protein
MCGTPQKAAAARFPALPAEVLNKVIHRRADRLQFFSGILNLAAKLKFYFNFDGLTASSTGAAMRPYAVSVRVFHTAA